MAKKDKPPPPIVTLASGRLSPASQWDAELVDGFANGAEFDLVFRGKRSIPHNRKYWAQLGLIVKATEAYPSSEKMHDWIKFRLGYIETIYNPTGNPIAFRPESTAFDEMDQPAFNIFYKQAVRLVLEEMGIDMMTAWSLPVERKAT